MFNRSIAYDCHTVPKSQVVPMIPSPSPFNKAMLQVHSAVVQLNTEKDQRIATLERQIQEQESVNQRLQNEKQELKSEKQKLQCENEKLASDNEKLEDDNFNLYMEKSMCEDDKEQLVSKLQTTGQDLARTKREKRVLNDKVVGAQKVVATAKELTNFSDRVGWPSYTKTKLRLKNEVDDFEKIESTDGSK